MTLTLISKILRQLDVYPNVDIAIRMALSAPVTNCTGERSFSTLRRVKNYLRSSTSHGRLTSLSLLTIERMLTQNIQYNGIIDTFARTKARREAL